MIYILFGCFLAFSVFDWIQIRKVARHDGVLFPFCQLRRDIMTFLYENVFEKPGTLSHEEYVSIRRLLDVLNDTIKNYNSHKVYMFNIRKVVKDLDRHKEVLQKVASLEVTENQDIKKFHQHFAYCFAKAFLAYTPLIRSQATMGILFLSAWWVYRASYQTISEQLKTESRRIRDAANRVVAPV